MDTNELRNPAYDESPVGIFEDYDGYADDILPLYEDQDRAIPQKD